MIRPLRQCHRRLFAVIGVLLPVAFVVGVAARKPVPSAATLPGDLAASTGHFILTDGQLWNLFQRASIRVRLLNQPGTPRRAIRLFARQDFVKPDLLVYWLPGRPAVTNRLPANATLLGSFSTPALELPPEAAKTEGTLILFSLADQEIVDVSQPAQFIDSTR
jgi:hypothetical protein